MENTIRNNRIIIDILSLLRLLRELNNEEYSARALRNAIEGIEKLNVEITSGIQAQNLVPRMGKKCKKYIDGILENIDEDRTGIDELDELSEEDQLFLYSISEMVKIPGIGMKKALKYLDQGYNIFTLREFLANGGGTTRQRIGIKYASEFERRIPREKIDYFNIIFKSKIKKYNTINETKIKYVISGSYSRGSENSGDLDIILYSKREGEVCEHFSELINFLNGILIDTLSQGLDSYQGVAYIDEDFPSVRIDIKTTANMNEYYYALLYFTGPGKFNEKMRNKARIMGYKLGNNEMIRLSDGKKIIVHSEKEIFDILKMNFLQPSERN